MSIRTDFRTPFFAVAIRNSYGTLPLWQLKDDSDQVSFQFENKGFAWVQQVTVENQLGDVPILSAMLTPPFREGLEFLDSPFIEYGNSELQIQIGYEGLAPQVFTGILLEPAVSIGTDMQITLNAHGTGGFASIRNESGRKNRPGETRLELIRRIAAGNGGKSSLTVDDSFVRAGETGGGGGTATSEDVKAGSTLKLLDAPVDYSQGGKSDWTAMWELVNGANAWMVLVSKASAVGEETAPTLRILPRDKSMKQAPTRVFRMYGLNQGRIGVIDDPSVKAGASTGAAPAEYPIDSLSNPPMGIYLPGVQRGAILADISDKNPDEENKVVLNSDNVKQVRSSEGKASNVDSKNNPEYDSKTDEGGGRIPGDPESLPALENAAQEFRKMANLGIQLDIQTVGIPDLAPGEVVKLAGLGKRFGDPNWGVHKIVHSVGTGGFSTSVTVVSNADSVLAHGNDHKDEVNDKEPKADNEIVAEVKTTLNVNQ